MAEVKTGIFVSKQGKQALDSSKTHIGRRYRFPGSKAREAKLLAVATV